MASTFPSGSFSSCALMTSTAMDTAAGSCAAGEETSWAASYVSSFACGCDRAGFGVCSVVALCGSSSSVLAAYCSSHFLRFSLRDSTALRASARSAREDSRNMISSDFETKKSRYVRTQTLICSPPRAMICGMAPEGAGILVL